MTAPAEQPAATGFALTADGTDEHAPEFERLWHGFMTTRVMLGLALLLFALVLRQLGQAPGLLLPLVSSLYLTAALAARLLLPPKPLGAGFGLRWLSTVGVDLAAFTALQALQGHVISLTPLYALPVLLAAVLAPLLTALGTAAAVALLLLADAAMLSGRTPADAAPLYIQAALASAGGFAIAALAHQLTEWLAREERRARRHQQAAQLQLQVNALVIEATSDGILVADATGTVRATNPAAQQMLQSDDRAWREPPFSLDQEPAWRELADLVRQSLRHPRATQIDLDIAFAGQGARRLRARTRLTTAPGGATPVLCVVFMQDLRELEARLRTDKLASMGRMSAAVAHEIRNPLAAIVQANALLEEELEGPRQRQLTGIVRQNARRLEATVEEILNLSRAHSQAPDTQALDLSPTVAHLCAEWAGQTGNSQRLRLNLDSHRLPVRFGPEHLRRVLINLLDNAARYAGTAPDAIQVSTGARPDGRGAVLRVWSDGAPIEASVEQHLFEPFFSSESRSSGLGLYICRELCERHGAAIGYRRAARPRLHGQDDGNEFFVSLSAQS